MATVSDSNNRLNDASATTGWTSDGGGGAGPGVEPDFFYQGAAAISRKIGASGGGFQYNHGSGTNMTTGDDVVWMAKGLWTNKDALDPAPSATLRLGSSSANFHQYYVADDGTQGDIDYPLKGGWLIVPINPNVTAWRDSTTGSPTLSSVSYFGIQGDFTAASKGENVILDAIDLGGGLWVVGSGASFDDFVGDDQGDVTNGRFGHVTTSPDSSDILSIYGTLVIGRTSGATVTSTQFADANRVLVFPGGRVAAGWNSLELDLGNASTTVDLTAVTVIGAGRSGLITPFCTELQVDGTNEELDITGHGMATGEAVQYSNFGGSEAIGLTSGNEYFVNAVDANTISLHTTRQNAFADTSRVNLTASSAGNGENHGLVRIPDTRPDFDVTGTSGSATVTGCSFNRLRQMNLTAGVALSACVFNECDVVDLNEGTADACVFNEGLLAPGAWQMDTPDLTDVTNCEFNARTVKGADQEIGGHAIRTDDSGTVSFSGNVFTGYGPAARPFHTINDVDAAGDFLDFGATAHGYTTGMSVIYQKHGGTDSIGLTNSAAYYVNALSATRLYLYPTRELAIQGTSSGRIALSDGSTGETHAIYSLDAAIFNDSGAALTINVTGGGNTPSIRNAEGSSTTVNLTVALTFTGIPGTGAGGGSTTYDSEVRVYSVPGGAELDGSENVSGGSFVYSFDGADAGNSVDVVVVNLEYEYLRQRVTLPSVNSSQALVLRLDPRYSNP